MPHPIPDQQMSRLSQFIARWLGLHFPKKRWRDLERIMTHAAPELGFQEMEACIHQLVSGQLAKGQEELLASRLTIGETYFFRDQKSFEILESQILPDLIASRRGGEQRLRIWSAGCSSGEEPYSLAIMLCRLIPDLRNWNVTILATDINSYALAKAKKGVYAEWSFRGVPERIRQNYFTPARDKQFELSHAIRKMVTFAPLNLAEDRYPSLSTNTNAMDLILCRNVLMYFEQKQQQRVIQGFQHSLLDNGWLAVSPCETSADLSASFETVMFPGAVFYRKQGAATEPQWISLPISVALTPDDIAPPAGELFPTVPLAPLPLLSVACPTPVAEMKPSPVQPAISPYEEALELYRQGSYAEVEAALSVMFVKGEATNSAEPLLAKAAALMAQTQANQGNIASALIWSEKAIAIDKLNAELYYLRATIFQEQGDVPLAIASLKQALYLDHGFVTAYFALGTLTMQQGKPKVACRHFDNALSLLGAFQDDDPVPGADGMTAGRLKEVITLTRASRVKG